MSRFIPFIFVLAAFAVLTVFLRKSQKQVGLDIAQFATTHGLTYIGSAAAKDILDAAIFKPLDLANTRPISIGLRNVMRNPSGRLVYFADVNIATGNQTDGDDQIQLNLFAANDSVKIPASFMLLPKGKEGYYNTDGMTQLKFEGTDLNNIYVLYAKPGDEVSTLQLLAPDTMLWLVKANPNAALIQSTSNLYVLMPDIVSMKSASGTLTSLDYQFELLNSICQRLGTPANTAAQFNPAAQQSV